jgi:GAF domain-containing protein
MTLAREDVEALSAGAAKSPAALYEAINQVAIRRLGAGLVTSMRHLAAEQQVERLYSSNTTAYPVGGRKTKRDTAWSRKVLAEHQVLLSAGDEQLKVSFDDHATIIGLGLHSCLNVPLVSKGQCVGTLNISRAQAQWSDDEIALARALGLAALSAVLMLT